CCLLVRNLQKEDMRRKQFKPVSLPLASKNIPSFTRATLCFLLITLFCAGVLASAQSPDSDEEGQFRFRFVGPKVGNRVAAIAGIPGDASTYYAGAASGGIWKSVDG